MLSQAITTLQTKYSLDMHSAAAIAQLQAKHNMCYQTLPKQKVKIAKNSSHRNT